MLISWDRGRSGQLQKCTFSLPKWVQNTQRAPQNPPECQFSSKCQWFRYSIKYLAFRWGIGCFELGVELSGTGRVGFSWERPIASRKELLFCPWSREFHAIPYKSTSAQLVHCEFVVWQEYTVNANLSWTEGALTSMFLPIGPRGRKPSQEVVPFWIAQPGDLNRHLISMALSKLLITTLLKMLRSLVTKL
jgi:hypothetical protein